MKIAYFINQYPKVSHSFIRREILALERQGFNVGRFALRGWDSELVDPDDLVELERTRFVLKDGLLPLLLRFAGNAVRQPLATARGLAMAFSLANGGDRTLLHHLVSLAEASVLAGWLRADGVQHVHAHFGTNSAEVVMLARALGGPAYSFTVHGPDEWDMPEQLKLRDKVRDAKFVVGISSFTRAQLCRWVRAEDQGKIHIVHCGLEASFHHGAAVPAPDNRTLVCIGRLSRQKAQYLLIDAIAKLKQRGSRVDVVLGGDGEMRPEIEAKIAAQGLQDQVRLTGWISSDDVRRELLAARAMVLPSFAEGLPVVLMEALAVRRPVLTTYIAGIPELVRDGQEGWLVPAGSPDELADAIDACLAMPIDTLRAMGDRGHARVIERHSVDTEALKLAALIRGVDPVLIHRVSVA
jgi:glycosyltransferase involved in cell wall biosynthesis